MAADFKARRSDPMFVLAIAVHVVHAHKVDPRGSDGFAEEHGVAGVEFRSVGNAESDGAGGDVGVGDEGAHARCGLLKLAHDTQGLVGRAGHFDGGAAFAAARTAQDDTRGRDGERTRAVKISCGEFDCAAKAVHERKSGNGIEGGLNGGGVV